MDGSHELQPALETLLAPGDHADARSWLDAAARALKPALGADAASGYLPLDRLVATSDAWDMESLSSYPSSRKALEKKWRLRSREVELGVFSRRLVYGRRLRALYRSAYYNEFLRPQRAYDGIGIAVPVPGRRRPAYLLYHHTSPRGPRFGERGLDVLRAVRPAFVAGVNAWVRAEANGAERRASSLTLDALGRPFVAADLEGRWIHATPPVAALLEDAAGRLRGRLEAGVRTLCRQLRGLLTGARTQGRPPAPSLEVRTHRTRLRLVAHLSAPHAFGPERAVVVEIEAVDLRPVHRRLAERFGLTPRESEVAGLLARRRTNREIAETLGVTGHTARRHTERVLRKLGVSSRFEVEGVLEG